MAGHDRPASLGVLITRLFVAVVAMRYMLSVCVEKNERGRRKLGKINSNREKKDLKKILSDPT